MSIAALHCTTTTGWTIQGCASLYQKLDLGEGRDRPDARACLQAVITPTYLLNCLQKPIFCIIKSLDICDAPLSPPPHQESKNLHFHHCLYIASVTIFVYSLNLPVNSFSSHPMLFFYKIGKKFCYMWKLTNVFPYCKSSIFFRQVLIRPCLVYPCWACHSLYKKTMDLFL